MTSSSDLEQLKALGRPNMLPQFAVDESLPDNELAHMASQALTIATKSHDALVLIIGKLLKVVRDRSLYKSLDYETFSQYLESPEISFSREKAYMYIKIYEFYVETLQLSQEMVGSINVSRLSMMVPVLKGIEDKQEILEKIEQLGALRHGDFVREVKQQTNKEGKPSVYWDKEQDVWVVSYYENRTVLRSLGQL